ncbi:T9SS type A sorting domain-containing protein [Thermaurantimonas aggregans]|nr:T9SS type A sorting domain-containing protein [Thermaurantimonas aggregans]
MCWWSTDENIYFKAARTPPSPAYRYQNPENTLVLYKDKFEQGIKLVEIFDVDQHITVNDISGKILFRGNVSEVQNILNQFSKGIYLITAKNGINKKLLIQ